MISIGILGFGTIGRQLANQIWQQKAGDTKLLGVLVRNPGAVSQDLVQHQSLAVVTRLEHLPDTIELIVEVAGHQAVRQYAEAVLESGRDLMAVSVGAFADEELYRRVRDAAIRNGRKLLVPSGAVAGLDAISAAALADIESITHTTRKHPRAFTPEQLADRQDDSGLLYDGPSREGVERFPENVNVAAAVCLAGIGFDRTRLRVFADPSAEKNIQEVEASGYFGNLRIRIENTPSENPKTGRIVVLSIARALKRLSDPVVIGC